MTVTSLLIIGIMLLLNSVFAAYELALASTSLARLQMLAEQHRVGAAAAVRMKERIEGSLAMVQIGITLVAALAAAMGAGAEDQMVPWLGEHLGLTGKWARVLAIALVVLPLSATTIVVGELVPKTFALRNSEWVCLKLSPAMRAFALLAHPAVAAFEWVTGRLLHLLMRTMPPEQHTEAGKAEMGLAELLAHARTLRSSRVIGPQQERMILGASKLSELKVRDIAVPADQIVMLNYDGTLVDHWTTAHLEAHTRMLVTTRPGDPQGIVGYVNVKELLFLAKTHPADPHLRQITRPAPSLPAEMSVGEAFGRMMNEHMHLALVREMARPRGPGGEGQDGTAAGSLGPTGGAAAGGGASPADGAPGSRVQPQGPILGMITLEDILEEVVGDIQDEFDRLPRTVIPSGTQWVVGGGAPLDRVRAVMARQDFAADAQAPANLSDWLVKQLGRTPRGGDIVEAAGIRVLVRKVRRHRVQEALVDPAPPPMARAGDGPAP